MGRNWSMNSTAQFQYQACLLPKLPEEIERPLEDIMYVVHPLAALVAVMSLVCNTLVLFIVKRFQHFRHPSQLILCSLAFTDLIFALHTLVREALLLFDPHTCLEPAFEDYVMYIGILCYLATLANLAMISRDRYLALSKPLWYCNHMTRSRALKGIALTWLASSATTLLVFTIEKSGFGSTPFFIVIVLFYVGSIPVILLNYFRFFMANRRNTRVLGRNVSVVQREKKLTRVVSLILLCFLFTFLPALLVPVVLVAMGFPVIRFQTLNTFVMTINGFLNPLVNFGRNKDMHRALFYVIKCQQGRAFPQVNRYNRNTRNQNGKVAVSNRREMPF